MIVCIYNIRIYIYIIQYIIVSIISVSCPAKLMISHTESYARTSATVAHL